jgi:hypothetical protein
MGRLYSPPKNLYALGLLLWGTFFSSYKALGGGLPSDRPFYYRVD